jgi:hypothetical protein
MWMGALGVVFLGTLAILRGPVLPGGFLGTAFVAVPTALVGFAGYLFHRWSPTVVREVSVDDTGVTFGNPSTRGWSISWADPSLSLDIYLYPTVPASVENPFYGIQARVGHRSTYLLREAYDAIITSARNHRLTLVEAASVRPGVLMTTIRPADGSP